MLILELEEKGRFRIWSEENACYVLENSTIYAVTNFFRQQAIMRADMALKQYVLEATAQGVCPPRTAVAVAP